MSCSYSRSCHQWWDLSADKNFCPKRQMYKIIAASKSFIVPLPPLKTGCKIVEPIEKSTILELVPLPFLFC